ncbi:hypothetical protein GTA08_BOTSDO06421 [Neofusicoccum parvum]|uniref:Uncharacterized protein n=1 Tax=Neofusicoccum parvum TaxID=310453 RepID=A0ACB5SE52_9PEZI|nr:hypothetical protein GTA08_BOTSDO06421 [Neofusicoccum parvum]
MAADYDAEDMEQLWRATLEKYKGLTGISLEDQPLTKEEMDGRIKMIRGHKSDVIRVQNHLKEIENLAKHEQSLTLAAIYGMSRYAEKVLAGEKKPSSKYAKAESAESKQAHPSEEEDVEDIDPALWKSWAEVEKEMKASFIKEVGSWLVKHEIFSAWMMVQLHKSDTTLSQAEPTLIIQGNDGLGKSYLAYQAATIIKSEVKSRPQELSLAAFYFRSPERNPKTNHTDGESYTLRDALLAIIRQLTRSDPNYREFVTERCGLTGLQTKMSTTDLWTKLVIGYKTHYQDVNHMCP